MKFEFEIKDAELFDYDKWNDERIPLDFKELLLEKVIDCIADKLWDDVEKFEFNKEVSSSVKAILNTHEKDIVDNVIKNVSGKIVKKKQIIEMTPKAKELATIDKDNEQYFIELIDKAIAKRFK